jgi:DNA-binding transcriptional regulator YhcF (GntR family)
MLKEESVFDDLGTKVYNRIKHMIISGELKPGSSLPTIRSLASQLEVANNTVARAYQELETLGLAESKGRRD